jgi:hypothetical protein
MSDLIYTVTNLNGPCNSTIKHIAYTNEDTAKSACKALNEATGSDNWGIVTTPVREETKEYVAQVCQQVGIAPFSKKYTPSSQEPKITLVPAGTPLPEDKISEPDSLWKYWSATVYGRTEKEVQTKAIAAAEKLNRAQVPVLSLVS